MTGDMSDPIRPDARDRPVGLRALGRVVSDPREREPCRGVLRSAGSAATCVTHCYHLHAVVVMPEYGGRTTANLARGPAAAD